MPERTDSVGSTAGRWTASAHSLKIATAISLGAHLSVLLGFTALDDREEAERERRHDVLVVAPPPPPQIVAPASDDEQQAPGGRPEDAAQQRRAQQRQRNAEQRREAPEANPLRMAAARVSEAIAGDWLSTKLRATAREAARQVAENADLQCQAPSSPVARLDDNPYERPFASSNVESLSASRTDSALPPDGASLLPPVEHYPARVQRALRRSASFARGAVAELSQRQRATFHEYFTQVHATLVHPVFAERFLRSLDRLEPRDPLNDWNLRLDIEFEILADGRVNELRVVYPSGIRRFDAAAVHAIYGAAPFPKPPLAIRSWNDRVYLRWGFHRNHRKCGVKNIRPYIIERSAGSALMARRGE